MGIENIDFQPYIHQQVSNLIEHWKSIGFTDDDVSENANQLFQMGVIAASQLQQEKVFQPEGSNQQIEYNQAMAEKVLYYFIIGMNAGILKAYEQKVPSEAKWPIIQNVAFYIFGQAKHIMMATFGQESTPEVQFSEEQLHNYLHQSAVEALLHFTTEYENQNGPLVRTDLPVQPDVPDLLSASEETATTPQEETLPQEPQPVAKEQPDLEPVAAFEPPTISKETHHKYAAVGLFLSTLPSSKQKTVLASFDTEAQELILQYQDPEAVAKTLDLALVAKYLKQFKTKMGGSKLQPKTHYATHLSSVISKLPADRLEKLFYAERPLVRGYIAQIIQNPNLKTNPYQLPPGVEESLVFYLQRNFPSEEVVSSR